METKQKFGLSDLAAIYILLWTIMPSMSSGTLYRVVLIGCAGIFVLSNFHEIFSDFVNLIAIVLLLGLYFALSFVAYGQSYAIAHTINLNMYILVWLIGRHYFEHMPEKMLPILTVILLACIFVSVQAIRIVLRNPGALRAATHSEESHSYASYSYVFLSAQLVPFLLLALKKYEIGNNRFFQAAALVCLVTSMGLVVCSGFLMANILMLLGIACIIVFYRFSATKLVAALLILLFIVLFYRVLLETAFELMLNLTKNNPYYYKKFYGFYKQLFFDAGTASSYSRRLHLYVSSYTSLVNYPLLGSIVFTGRDKGGGHSSIIDMFAAYGWVPGILYIRQLLGSSVRMIKTCETPELKRVLLVCLLSLVLINGCFDALSYTCAWVWYLLIPFVIYKAKSPESLFISRLSRGLI